MSDDARDCFRKYLANAAFAQKLEDQFPEEAAWSCVVRFYAALHLINAYLIDKKNVRLDPEATAHMERKAAMDKCPELRDAPKKYRELKDLSERARYDATWEYTPARHDMAKAFLAKIVAIVEPKLKKD
jgi:hypothetical protein